LTPIKPAIPVDFAGKLTIFSAPPPGGNFFAQTGRRAALNFCAAREKFIKNSSDFWLGRPSFAACGLLLADKSNAKR
jgi:hypothetical protein